MRAYPLIRRKWSNEHVMAALFGVLILYMVPGWLKDPTQIPAFLVVLAAALIIDAAAGFIQYKHPVCCVSAAVTAGILQIITPGVPLWGRLVGIAAAILLGKVVWGGTGKNTLNPAIVGYLAIYLLFSAGYAPINPSVFLIPALVLSLPFILFRPFTCIGLITGMAVAMFTTDSSAALTTILVNSIFFGCIIMTDPVTTTPLKIPGFVGAFAVGFLPLITVSPALNFALAILIFNLISYMLDDFRKKSVKRPGYKGILIKNAAGETEYNSPAKDLTTRDESDKAENDSTAGKYSPDPADSGPVSGKSRFLESLSSEQIIERIRSNGVYGCGGAAFPTAEKIKAARSSDADRKYLIINGAECDPGLVHDKWLLRNRSDDIAKGVRAVCRCIDFSEIFLAAKDISGLQFPGNIKLHQVTNYYPAGYEKTLVYSILKNELPDGVIPSDEGILVLNVQTFVRIYEAVYLNKKVTDKYITVSDMKEGKSSVVKVKTGESVMKILDAVYQGKQPVFTGGGAMQAFMADETSVVEGSTNFIAVSDMPRYKESPFCSGCGECEENCPMGLKVNRIAELVDADKIEETFGYGPEKCIKCGICSYVCPGGRNLSARVTEARNAVLKHKAGI